MPIGNPHLLLPYFRWKYNSVTLTASPVIIVGSDPSRVALILTCFSNHPLCYGPTEFFVNNLQGFYLNSAQTVSWLYHDYGALVGLEWSAVSLAPVVSEFAAVPEVPLTVFVCEVSYDPQG